MAEALEDLESLVTEWLFDKQSERRAAGTIRNYHDDLLTWGRWLRDRPTRPRPSPTSARTHRCLHRLALARREAGHDRQQIPPTESDLNWAEEQEILTRSPMARMHEPVVPENPPPVFTTAQLKAIFTTTKADKTFKGIRDYAILLVLADTGCRAAELVSMKLSGIDYNAHTIEVLGKGSRVRNVAFGAKTGKALLAYRRARSQQTAAAGHDELWIGVRGPLADSKSVWQLVRQRAVAAGIDGRAFPHLFRHTFGHLLG